MARGWWKALIALTVLLSTAGAGMAAGRSSVVTFWYYGSALDFEVLEKIAADFEAEHPDIDVEVVNVPYTTTWEKWAVAVAGGVPPDASMANWGVFQVMADALEPLERYAARSREIQPRNFFPAHWAANWFNGHMLGLPFRANSQVILYNKQMFRDAGLGALPRTWSELAATATRLTLHTGNEVERWGFSFRNFPHNRTVNHFAQRNGWQPFNAEYTEAYYNDPKLIETLSFLNDMVMRGVAAIQGMPGVGNLAGGEVAMLNEGPWVLSGIRRANPDIEVGAFVPPAGPSGAQPYANMGGENLVMFKDGQNKEAAWEWLVYLAYTRNAEYNRLTGAFFPVVTYAAQQRDWLESEIWRAVLDNYNEGRLPRIGTPCGVRFAASEAYDRALDDILHQRKPIQGALEEVQQIALADLKSPALQACLQEQG
ncbi:MAG TPA: extracellular solute-binding protein [Limnochordia bacterium]